MARRSPRLALALALSLTVGCGARTLLSLGEDAGGRSTDAASPDAEPPDAEPPDAEPQDAGPPDAGPPPDACRRDPDCAAPEVCRAADGFAREDLTPLPLRCGRPTAGAAPVTADCRLREECDRGLCAVAGACVRPCVTVDDCDGSEVCAEVYVTTARAAMQTVQACVAEVAAADDVDVEFSAGVSVTFDEAVVDPVRFEANTLVIYLGAPASIPFLAAARDATGATVFDAGAIGGAPDWGLNPVALNSAVALLYPNGPRSPAPGVFELGLASLGADTDTRRAVARRTGEGQTLDLDLYLVGGNRWSAPDGSLPPGLSLGVEDARDVFAAAGVELGEVRLHEVVGGLRTRLSILRGAAPPFDAPEDLDALFRLTAGARRPGVHVFFVREIDGALGISAGIPGAQVLPGTGASGVAISADLLPTDELGGVIAHEVGHFLGLFHSSEFEGTVSDPYPDTPECTADADTNGDGFVDPFECEGRGAENLMFWAGSGVTLSAEQAAVLRSSPLLRR